MQRTTPTRQHVQNRFSRPSVACVTLLAAFLATLLTGPVTAQGDLPPWAGFWAEDPAQCALAGEWEKGAPALISEAALFGMNLNCKTRKVTPLDTGTTPDAAWRLDLTCTNNGVKTEISEDLELTGKDSLLLTQPDGTQLGLTRCAKPLMPPPPSTKAACEAIGGRWEALGLLQTEACVRATPDAGKACDISADCTAYCDANTRTCAHELPFLGCISQLKHDGSVFSICTD